MNILEALDDDHLFRGAIRNHSTWQAWRAFLAALFGLPMSDTEADVYRACTGRETLPQRSFEEAWLVCGRRAGKSFTMALTAVFLACFREYGEYLARGERATIMVIAADRKQARVIMRYVRGLLTIPMLARLIERETSDGFDLTGSVTIEVGTASHRAVRGYTIAAILADEIAFWPTDEGSASPDTEILAALRPAMATIPGAMLIAASSPYAKRGAMWEAFRRYFGKDGAPVLVWRASTRTMNPTVPQSVIDEAMERDTASASAEYLAEFRSDIESFIAREVVDAVTIPGRFELPPMAAANYVAFVDPSGGSADSMTLAIAHTEGEVAVLDAVREVKPPFSPDGVVQDFAALLRLYRVHRITGDRYAGEWPRERFRAAGIAYEPSERAKSEIYGAFLPLANSRRVELLDLPRISSQLTGLERRTARGGRDTIDHGPGQHDDLANAVAGALVLADVPQPTSSVEPLRIWA